MNDIKRRIDFIGLLFLKLELENVEEEEKIEISFGSLGLRIVFRKFWFFLGY